MDQNIRKWHAYIILTSIFIGCYCIAPLIALKPLDMGFAIAPAGVLIYSLLFPCTDIITEIYGKKMAQMTIIGGLIAMLIVALAIQIALIWPAPDFWQHEESFNQVFGVSWRIFLGSFVAYSSQFIDVYLFDFVGKLTKGRYLWLRNNISTLTSQLVATALFVTIAFYGVYETQHIINLIFTSMLVRLIFAISDTPVVYASVWFISRYNGKKIP
jgi:uncharacterized integral membrane protein (TIGR00697 family)